MHIGVDLEEVDGGWVAVSMRATRGGSDDTFLVFARYPPDEIVVGRPEHECYDLDAGIFERIAVADPVAWRVRDVDDHANEALRAYALRVADASLALRNALTTQLQARPLPAGRDGSAGLVTSPPRSPYH
jgi:hypothetical protein